MRDITKTVAKLRFIYHTNMLDVCNIANQLGLLSDEKAEYKMKNHTMQSFECLERLGYNISKIFDDTSEKEV